MGDIAFEVRTPAEGRYQPHLQIASTDELPIVEAVLKGQEARVMEEPLETEDDGKGTTVAYEPEDSERNRMLARVAEAEAKRDEELRQFQPLTPEDAQAKREALLGPTTEKYNSELEALREAHPDFDSALANLEGIEISEEKRRALLEAGPAKLYEFALNPEEARKFAALDDSAAEEFLQAQKSGESPAAVNSAYEKALAEEHEAGRDVVAFADIFHKPLFTNDEEGQARYLDLAAIVSTLPNADEVVIALGRDTAAVQKIVTAKSGADVQRLLKALSAKLQFPVTEQPASAPVKPRSNLGPTRPVGGSAKGTVPMDQMSYQEYRAAREKEIKARRTR